MIRAPYSSNKQSRYVELVFVVDNKEFKELGTVEAVSGHCKKIANIINSVRFVVDFGQFLSLTP